MGILNWKGLPVVSGTPRPGIKYFCTLRMEPGLSTRAGGAQDRSLLEGASRKPYSTFNLGDHVGDNPSAVRTNRETLASTLPSEPVWLQQVHGTEVYDADSQCLIHQPCQASDERVVPAGTAPVADASVTQAAGRVLCIMTADCLPVLLHDDQGTIVGLAHAGWRGLAQGVLEVTLAALQERAPRARWQAWIGPAIGQVAFEVGDEVRHTFLHQDTRVASYFTPGRAGRWQADLAGLAAYRLKKAGVSSVECSGLCTHARPDLFYSYRRDGVTGRMATVAWLEG